VPYSIFIVSPAGGSSQLPVGSLTFLDGQNGGEDFQAYEETGTLKFE